MTKDIFIVVIALITLIGGWYFFSAKPAQAPTVQTGTGVRPGASEYTYNNASGDTILVDTPQPGATVGKTFAVSGKARGPWYFEASFPIEVQDKDGNTLTQLPATANGEWMTEDFVPFSVTVTYTGNYTGPAMLILRKDNPSGLPEHEASVLFPITIQ